jgi:hypothetical protein
MAHVCELRINAAAEPEEGEDTGLGVETKDTGTKFIIQG